MLVHTHIYITTEEEVVVEEEDLIQDSSHPEEVRVTD